jgi:GT2 family glycosyltransferase
MRLAVVTPTRNRPKEVATLLTSLRAQTRRPDLLVVVDGSDAVLRPEVRKAVQEGCPDARYIEHWPPSAAAQRNRGFDAALEECELVALVDDDVTLPPDALENACREIAQAAPEFIGFGFNPSDADAVRGYGRLKSSRLARRLGLYSDRVGAVTASGWHTRLTRVAAATEVEWLTTCAAIWKAEAIRAIRFDEFFEQYSYLEDLEFSLQARTHGRLLALSSASFLHQPAVGGRKSRYWFGRIEIRNRHYIVRKHHLSRRRFWLGVVVRSVMTLAVSVMHNTSELARLRGNVTELLRLMCASHGACLDQHNPNGS